MNSSSNTILVFMFMFGLSACGSSSVPEAEGEAGISPVVEGGPATVVANDRTMQMWSQSCALCHVTGNGGAPRVGNAEEWLPRLAQGEDALLKHTLEGLNDMPPLGYCMACERDDFVAMINFMTENLTETRTGGAP